MIIEEEISHQNNNFFDLSHPRSESSPVVGVPPVYTCTPQHCTGVLYRCTAAVTGAAVTIAVVPDT